MKTPSPSPLFGTTEPVEYSGICEASAAVALDDSHFAVASDETNTFQVYRRGIADPVRALKFKSFIGSEKSDIEAAARIGDIVYWISSFSRPGKKGNAKGRSVLFATRIVRTLEGPTLEPLGKPYEDLRGDLKQALQSPGTDINIEGLAASPDGELLIGFRSPLIDGMAPVLCLKNPAGMTGLGEEPRFGDMHLLDLGNRGVRSIDCAGPSPVTYLVLAGPSSQSGREKTEDAKFALFSWTGDGQPPIRLSYQLPQDFTAEALVLYPEKRLAQVLSDDGHKNENENDIARKNRRFRSIDMTY